MPASSVAPIGALNCTGLSTRGFRALAIDDRPSGAEKRATLCNSSIVNADRTSVQSSSFVSGLCRRAKLALCEVLSAFPFLQV